MGELSSVPSEPRRGESLLRVLTYNTYIGHGLNDALRLIRNLAPHVVFLQELYVYRYPDHQWHQAESLAHELGMNHVYQRHVWRGRNEIGLALYAVGPISDARDIEGPTPRPTGLSARVEIEGRSIAVAAVHLARVPRPLILGYPAIMPRHRQQIARTLQRLNEMGGPAILAGDFNTLPFTPAHRLACRQMTDVARQAGCRRGTRTTLGLPMRIDYIFTSSHFQVEECRVLDAGDSDHRPVYAGLRLAGGTGTPLPTSHRAESL